MVVNRPLRRVSSMNGRSLAFFTLADFGQPGRRSQVGAHTTIWAALRVVATSTRGTVFGRMWVEDAEGTRLAGPFWGGGPRPTRRGS